jgi:hypothetical protein
LFSIDLVHPLNSNARKSSVGSVSSNPLQALRILK